MHFESMKRAVLAVAAVLACLALMAGTRPALAQLPVGGTLGPDPEPVAARFCSDSGECFEVPEGFEVRLVPEGAPLTLYGLKRVRTERIDNED